MTRPVPSRPIDPGVPERAGTPPPGSATRVLYDPGDGHRHGVGLPDGAWLGAIAQCECGRFLEMVHPRYALRRRWCLVSDRRAKRMLRKAGVQ